MKTVEDITLSAELVRHMLAGAECAQLDIKRLLGKCEIRQSDLEGLGARIPAKKAAKLAGYCCGVTQDEMQGLLEKPFPIGYFRLVSLSMVHAPTLYRALQRYIEFQNLQDNSFQYNLRLVASTVELTLMRIPGHRVVNDVAVNIVLTVVHRFLAWLGNSVIVPHRVTLDFAQPPYLSEFEAMYYGAPVLFNDDCIRLCFYSSDLDQPVVQSEASVESYFRRAPLDIFLPVEACGHVSQRVKKRLQDVCIASDISEHAEFEQLALDMGYKSPQSLRRKLRREGNTFHRIKAQVRRDIAIHYLGYDSMSIEAVAEKTGYSQSSAFVRAFKSWTGFTPVQFQKGIK